MNEGRLAWILINSLKLGSPIPRQPKPEQARRP